MPQEPVPRQLLCKEHALRVLSCFNRAAYVADIKRLSNTIGSCACPQPVIGQLRRSSRLTHSFLSHFFFLLLVLEQIWFFVLQDVVVGVLYAIIILIVFLPALDLIDNFNLTYKYSPLIIISLHLALGIFSFTLDTWSTSRGDTAQILGSGAGVACGSHVRYMLGLMAEPLPSLMPFTIPAITVNLLGKALLRVFVGLVILLPIRAVMKMVTIPLACKVFGIPCDDLRKARQSMEVELPYRYLTYGVVGFSVMFFVPYMFTCLGLQ